ncbi:MAG: hypothetical protein FJ278_06750 [Planctomycetes bacterium]|nr:hypothetical protein [Planctomycetota bacterium]
MTALSGHKVVEYLRNQLAEQKGLSIESKTALLAALREMGESIGPQEFGQYLTPADATPGNVKALEGLFRSSFRQSMRDVRQARDAVEAEQYLLGFHKVALDATGSAEGVIQMVEDLAAGGTAVEADFLYGLARTAPLPAVRVAAEEMLDSLGKKGVKPVTPVILDLGRERFHAAYMTDPRHEWQQSVVVAWERPGEVVQVLLFLLDFGLPWDGAIKDMFMSKGLTAPEFQARIIEGRGQSIHLQYFRVPLARAQATLAAAIKANRSHGIPLPAEMAEARHLVERWVLRPDPSVLAADTTRDELAHVPVDLDRPVLVDLDGLEFRDADEEDEEEDYDDEEREDEERTFEDFDELLEDVDSFHDTELEDIPWWRREWVKDHLTSLRDDARSRQSPDEGLEFLTRRWDDLAAFIGYLRDESYEFHALDDVRGFHVSECIVCIGLEDEGREWVRSFVDAVQGLFAHMAARGAIPSDHPLLASLRAMLARPDRVALPERPEPLGGEVAIWLTDVGEDDRYEPITYNEWWLALVLERRFKTNWDRCRREIAKHPDAAAKLALFDRLRKLQDEDDSCLDQIFWRPAEHSDHKRAQKWFDREPVNPRRAW